MNKKEKKQDYVIRVVSNDGEFLLITDLQNRYKSKIHQSLIKDNQFEMLDPQINNVGENCYNVGKSCFEKWLKNDIEAEAKRIRTEQTNLFYPNIPLFLEEENQKMILSEPQLYSIAAPERFYGMMYITAGNTKVTLGELLQIWEHEPVFSTTCKKCGGKSVVYFFGGSPLSGRIFEVENICIQCGKRENKVDTHSFGDLWRTRLKYKPIEPIAETPDTIESLVELCKKRSDKDLGETISENDNLMHVFETPNFIQIGNKKISNERFTKLLNIKNEGF